MSTPHPLVAALTAERLRRGLSRGTLALRLGYKVETIRKWETGQAAPGLDRLEDYAAALGYQLAIIPATRTGGRVLPLVTPDQAVRNRAQLADALGVTDDYHPTTAHAGQDNA